ncbi:E-selectin [Lingula anatina]|uniref:E-selectin n=1 Tax=Lingula anatina TaxID=7574 RepID=A0A1S3HHU7_LINAN|nr:E-selectin [Lingula anatina]XP_013385680.1 E-selectin [Lingula anatina]XP_013385681.1 E-selectin [Lingula anatina]|eukprot:XP_013385679.1 E-selectin [Lingula anatina]
MDYTVIVVTVLATVFPYVQMVLSSPTTVGTTLASVTSSPCRDPGELVNGQRLPVYQSGQEYHPFLSSISFQCKQGYTLVGYSSMLCTSNGRWNPPDMPICTNTKCPVPLVKNGRVLKIPGGFTPGSQTQVICDTGHTLSASDGSILCSASGTWSSIPSCTASVCPHPITISGAYYKVYGEQVGSGWSEGSEVVYSCRSVTNQDTNDRPLRCKDGMWLGILPSCENKQCKQPQDIENGRWYIVGVSSPFSEGSQVVYECEDNVNYSLIGAKTIVCTNKEWKPYNYKTSFFNHYPPRCIKDSGKVTTCEDPGNIQHGSRLCDPHKDCDQFYSGVSVHYYCLDGYEIVGGSTVITCTEDGVWTTNKPSCREAASTSDLGKDDHSETLAVVIATSGSVLGILVLILIAVAVKRRKSDIRLGRPITPPPPSYSRHCDSTSLDEHDRLALIAFADGGHLVLPTYAEATRTRGSTGNNSSSSNSVRGTPSRGEYRPLPQIPPSLRGNSDTASQSSHQVEGSTRHSAVTSSTHRDNMSGSVNFGSIETVNTINASVNASDGTSASVTIDTYDSSASNPSLALSRQAVTGSLASSNGSLANEDAPLLEHNNQESEQLLENEERKESSQESQPKED